MPVFYICQASHVIDIVTPAPHCIPMTVIRDDLAAPLMALSWTQAELARRLGVHVNTVSGWATGRTPMPLYAQAYLKLAVGASRLLKA